MKQNSEYKLELNKKILEDLETYINGSELLNQFFPFLASLVNLLREPLDTSSISKIFKEISQSDGALTQIAENDSTCWRPLLLGCTSLPRARKELHF